MKKIIDYSFLFALVFVSCKKNSEIKPAPEIFDFAPKKGSFNNTVTILGKNFDSLITSTSVKFNGFAGTVISVSDTLIKATVPENATTGKITITIDGRTTISDKDFIILSGKWILKKSLIAQDYDARHELISFVIGNKAYAGLGFNGGTSINDLWEYDPATINWTRKANCPIDIDGGIAMAINDKAYIVFGRSINFANGYHKQVWEYDPADNTWTRKADFPGEGRWGPFGIGLNGKGYVGMGVGDNTLALYDWWQYDPSSDSWAKKANVPSTANLFFSTGFAINNKIYTGTSAYEFGKDWFEYNPATDVWIPKADFPGDVAFAASGFAIGTKGYVAGGGSECWEYDPSSDSWIQKAFFGLRYAGTAFTLDNKGYYMNGSYYYNDQWEFIP